MSKKKPLYTSCLSQIDKFRPYKLPSREGLVDNGRDDAFFEEQSDFVTKLVLTMSSWSVLRFSKDMLLHEYTYLKKILAWHLQRGHFTLICNIIQSMQVFGHVVEGDEVLDSAVGTFGNKFLRMDRGTDLSSQHVQRWVVFCRKNFTGGVPHLATQIFAWIYGITM